MEAGSSKKKLKLSWKIWTSKAIKFLTLKKIVDNIHAKNNLSYAKCITNVVFNKNEIGINKMSKGKDCQVTWDWWRASLWRKLLA